MMTLRSPNIDTNISDRLLSGSSTYGLLTKCEVKMAGYWPSSFFACLWTDGVEVQQLTNKERRQYSTILNEKAWSIKDLLFVFRGKFLAGHGG